MAGLRVLFVAPSAYPLGGVQTWLDYLLPGLASRGVEPMLGLAAGRLHDVERYVRSHPGHQVIAIENPTGSAEGRVQALANAIRRTKPQLLVAVNIGDCYLAVARMRAAGEPTPRVAMADHSVEPDFLQDARDWRPVLDAFIGTNQLTVRLARDYAGLDRQRIHYAPYGVGLKTPSDPGGEQARGPLRIAYCGRVDDQQKRAQDIPTILDALERDGIDYRFRLAGSGPYLHTLTERLRPRIDRGLVELLGPLDATALDERLYAWAQVLLLTSFWETGPIVVWEAMARGLPVVSSRYIGAGLEGSLHSDENCLLFPIGNTDAAACQLRRMTEPALRAALAEKAYAMVTHRYSQEQSVAAWQRCLSKVMEQPQLAAKDGTRALQPAGRLDKWLGTGAGERVRRWVGRSHAHDSPGGEWPHAAHQISGDKQAAFWDMARKADAS